MLRCQHQFQQILCCSFSLRASSPAEGRPPAGNRLQAGRADVCDRCRDRGMGLWVLMPQARPRFWGWERGPSTEPPLQIGPRPPRAAQWALPGPDRGVSPQHPPHCPQVVSPAPLAQHVPPPHVYHANAVGDWSILGALPDPANGGAPRPEPRWRRPGTSRVGSWLLSRGPGQPRGLRALALCVWSVPRLWVCLRTVPRLCLGLLRPRALLWPRERLSEGAAAARDETRPRKPSTAGEG